MKAAEAVALFEKLDPQQELGMRWQNSENIRSSLIKMVDAMKRHDSEVGYMLRARDEVKRAEEECTKAELRAEQTLNQMLHAEGVLREEGFIVNESVYEP